MSIQHRGGTGIASWLRDSLRGLPLLMLFLLAFRQEARAYTDPGTGALIWQMLAAGFVGVLFYVRKFTNWFKRNKQEPEK